MQNNHQSETRQDNRQWDRHQDNNADVISTEKQPNFIISETAVEAAPLKMPATDAGETSGTHNLRPRPTSPEDSMYIAAGRESLKQ